MFRVSDDIQYGHPACLFMANFDVFYKTSLYSTSVSNSKFIDPAKQCLVQYKEDVKQEVTHQTNQMKSLLPPKLIGKME
jgi:hypothetical protein